jgi:hypothetical protein
VHKLRTKLTYANVMATIAVFLVLGGGAAVAAGGLGRNTVGSNQLKKNSVGTLKLKDNAVTGAKVQPGSLPASVFSAGAIKPSLGSTVTVIKTVAPSIPKDNFAGGTVNCPAGFQAISGGVDPDGVLSGKVSSSSPAYNGTRAGSLPDGQTGPANGWQGFVSTAGGPAGVGVVKIVVVCAPLG